ncbi:hypothetical protein GCM10027413_02900 [Conyzicola nivalis]|uniref:Uncharacterized protein n=1 Tax=Conyzicola nivalis TaxID=1477021 RepID=A0A916SNY3_9MICO|nr:hypothetical protein [Conyzicola nivalis]GGB08444.1 hypothetical protein GCM10010979_23740 [Conyzicola nivalis]
MPHAYELHVDVTAQCLCCLAPRVFRFASPSDQVVCATCVSHLGTDKSERRDREHVTMWAHLAADQQVNHHAEVERLRANLADEAAVVASLRAESAGLTAVVAGEFAAGGVRDLLENDVVRRADRATELANRRNDRAMAVLWRLERLHHENDAKFGACACGEPVLTCKEFAAIEPERQAVRDWEKKNAALAAEGKRHALPAEHPAAGRSPRR